MKRIRWQAAPLGVSPVQRQNFINVQVDAIGIGLSSAAAAFLPVYLTRLEATPTQVGLLSAMPALTGLILAIPVGRFLQTRRQVVPWFSLARLLVVSCYALTGLVSLAVPADYRVVAVLAIWALATLPQTVVMVSFTVVMNAVAGPTRRYDLMSRRWSILGATTAVTVAVAGQVLDKIAFPLNYQLTFLGLSLGGLVSYYFSSHITLPDAEPPPLTPASSLRGLLQEYRRLIASHPAFVTFSIKRFVFMSGWMLATPLFPLYFVRVVDASDAWIGLINTVQSAILLVGYFLWTRETRLRGSRFVLLWTTLGLSLYPALVAGTQRVELIAAFAGLAGIFQAGLDLVFFDELLKTVPTRYSATFVSIAQSLQHFSAVLAPLVGTALAGSIGIGGALLVSAALRFTGFALFAFWRREAQTQPEIEPLSEEPA